jgi:hypothetical protein
MENVTYIIPVSTEFPVSVSGFEKTLTSIAEAMKGCGADYNVIIAANESSLDGLQEKANKIIGKGRVSVVGTKDGTDIFGAINEAVNTVLTKYFCIVELGDTVMDNAYKNFIIYSESEKNLAVYMPICMLSDAKNEDKIIGLSNEIAWASSFADEYGYINKGALEAYVDFNVTGAFINTEDFIAV